MGFISDLWSFCLESRKTMSNAAATYWA